MAKIKTAHYSSAEERIEFDYPMGWQVAESQGMEEPYFSVHVLGPSAGGRLLSTSIFVLKQPAKLSLLEDVEKFLSSHRALPEFQELSAESRKFRGHSAFELEFLHLSMGNPHKAVRPGLVQERSLFFQKSGSSYRASLTSAKSTFARFLWAYDLLLKTLKVD